MKVQIQKWVFTKYRPTDKCKLGAKRCPWGPYYCLLGFEAIFKNTRFFASLGDISLLTPGFKSFSIAETVNRNL